MLKILVAGGLNEEKEDVLQNEKDLQKEEDFAKLLGREIIDQGHMLLNCCLTNFDRIIAENAYNRAEELKKNPSDHIVSYVLPNQKLAHEYGTVLKSQLKDWEIGNNPKFRVPEPIQLADAIILVGGFARTYHTADWGRIAKKPLLPVVRFGGTAERVFDEELDNFTSRYSARISRMEYQILSQLTSTPEEYVKTVVALAQLVSASQKVFVVMSFSNDPALLDVIASYKEVCNGFNYKCSRVDEESNVPRILPEILNRITESAFTLVDLSVESPNVYYELGYAEGKDISVIVTAKKGTQLPFDAKDIPVIFWENQTGLKEMLTKKIKAITETKGP